MWIIALEDVFAKLVYVTLQIPARTGRYVEACEDAPSAGAAYLNRNAQGLRWSVRVACCCYRCGYVVTGTAVTVGQRRSS